MDNPNYHTSITVDATAHETFKSINNISGWWTEDMEGFSQELNDEFTVRFADLHVTKQKLVEVIADKKVEWLITDSKLNFVENKHEWTNTRVIFDIDEIDGKTKINFTHVGLVPQVQCYNSCTKGWDHFINGSLYKLLTEGKGTPGLF